MGKTNFDRLMKRYLTNQVTEEERIKIEAWLDVMKTEETSDLEMTDEEEEKLFQKIIANKPNIKEIEGFRPESLKRKKTTAWTLRIAASLFLVATIGYGVWEFIRSTNVSENAITKVTLNDGSLVWVHGKSKLSYYQNSGGRFAELEGEALFEIAKDASRPFTIRYKDVSVRVVGTSFNLKTGDSVELKVLTGKVNLSSSSNQSGLIIEPHQKAIYTQSDGIKKFSLATDEAIAIVANTDYSMQFVNATFDDVLERIQNKFDVSVKLSDDAVRKCHLNLDITDHSLESSLQMITAVLNVEYKVKGTVITFTGSGCK